MESERSLCGLCERLTKSFDGQFQAPFLGVGVNCGYLE